MGRLPWAVGRLSPLMARGRIAYARTSSTTGMCNTPLHFRSLPPPTAHGPRLTPHDHRPRRTVALTVYGFGALAGTAIPLSATTVRKPDAITITLKVWPRGTGASVR